jgi:hypothetical protein
MIYKRNFLKGAEKRNHEKIMIGFIIYHSFIEYLRYLIILIH